MAEGTDAGTDVGTDMGKDEVADETTDAVNTRDREQAEIEDLIDRGLSEAEIKSEIADKFFREKYQIEDSELVELTEE